MPFDSLDAPSEWMPPGRGGGEPDRPLSPRDKIVAVGLASCLAVITLANCKLLLDSWHG